MGIVIVLLAIAVGWAVSRFWLYPALGIPGYAPLILRPILGFLTAWWLLARTGHAWSEFGLARPRSLLWAAIAAVLLYAAVWCLLNYVAPYIAGVVGAESAPSILANIRGNVVAFAGWIALTWTVGAFAEELLFRGFLLNGVARAVGRAGWGLGVGVIAQAALFGMLHLYQGTFGFVTAFLFALLFGAAYLAAGRNLWPLVIAHGTWNTVGIAGVYFSAPQVGGG
ncbi:MAG TPA: type II CAAX endopeptidase family protein [Burkholderiaceae bacterium]|nr:type II CAAX endopeptidase family protein [Burkholderiaceae bacterium]